ncbi:type II secretion system F family protein [Tepidimicrobium xylanilyticum]
MPLYKYRAVSESGVIKEGYFDASSDLEVLDMLRKSNFYPISIEEDVGKDISKEIFPKKVTKKDLAIFCRQFYTMIDAGINIINCLDILEKQTENKTLQKAISIVKEDVQKGMVLSDAIAKHNNIFPSLLSNIVLAGEVSGNLDILMKRMAVYYEKEATIENKIKSALVYPTVLCIVTIAVIIFLLIVVMPTFVSMFEFSGLILPVPTRILLTLSKWLIDFWYLFIGAISILLAGIAYFKKTKKGRLLYDTLRIKIPGIRKNHIMILTSRFARTLATLFDSGIPLLEALDVVSNIMENQVLTNKLCQVKEDIRKGIPMSKAIKKNCYISTNGRFYDKNRRRIWNFRQYVG